MSNKTNDTAPIVAVFTKADAEQLRADMMRHPSYIGQTQLATVIDINTRKALA